MREMRRLLSNAPTLPIAAAATILALSMAPIDHAHAQSAKARGLAVAEDDMTLGSPDAPVTMIEYASLSCPHCAEFHNQVFGKIKKNYIDTGKVRFVYRDLPTSQLAYIGSMLAHCSGPERFFGFIDVLFKTQPSWNASDDPRSELLKIARMGGMSEAQFEACLKNKAILNKIENGRILAHEAFDFRSTPSFMINDEPIVGSISYETFAEKVDSMLSEG